MANNWKNTIILLNIEIKNHYVNGLSIETITQIVV